MNEKLQRSEYILQDRARKSGRTTSHRLQIKWFMEKLQCLIQYITPDVEELTHRCRWCLD